MNNIGQKIKELRKKNDLTQEKLADYIGVTYQSVSKWETGVTYPDLSLIVPLARLLHVTTDELLGANEAKPDARRIQLEEAYEKTWQSGDLEERYQIASTAVSEYPGDMKYLNWLAWCEAMLSFECAEDAAYAAEQEKAIKHFACVIENAVDEDVKASSIQGIVQYLGFRGRYDEARSYAELYPRNRSFSYDDVLSNCLQGDEAILHEQTMLGRMLYDLLLGIGTGTLAACIAQEQVLDALIPDGNYFHYHGILSENYLSRAHIYANRQDGDRAMAALKCSCEHMIAYDAFLKEDAAYCFTSPFFDKVECRPETICRTYRPGMETPKDEFLGFLGSRSFDLIRDREEFQALLGSF